jgi:hypothetical protein
VLWCGVGVGGRGGDGDGGDIGSANGPNKHLTIESWLLVDGATSSLSEGLD